MQAKKYDEVKLSCHWARHTFSFWWDPPFPTHMHSPSPGVSRVWTALLWHPINVCCVGPASEVCFWASPGYAVWSHVSALLCLGFKLHRLGECVRGEVVRLVAVKWPSGFAVSRAHGWEFIPHSSNWPHQRLARNTIQISDEVWWDMLYYETGMQYMRRASNMGELEFM